MALSYFGFSCDAVRAQRHLVLIRIDAPEYLDHFAPIARRAYTIQHERRLAQLAAHDAMAKRGVWTHGIVVRREHAAQTCLDLLRRGVKPWADPRRRRAA